MGRGALYDPPLGLEPQMKRILNWWLNIVGRRHWHAHGDVMRRRVDGGWETRPMTTEEEEDAERWFAIR